MKLLLLLLMLLQFQWTVRFFAAALSSLIHLLTLLSGMPGGVLLERQSYLLKNLLLLKKSTIANDFGGAYENAPGPLSMISEPFVCSRDELLLLSALGVGSRPGRDLPRVFFFLLSKGALGCFVLSPSCHVPLSLPFVWGSRARYGYGTSVSDKEGRGDDQMRCSCLIRGHPRGGCASLLSFSVPS